MTYRDGGPWLPEHHTGRKHWDDTTGEYDKPMMEMVWLITHPESVLDWGCGMGWYLGYFKSQGVPVTVGVEPYDMGDGFEGHRQIQHDMTQPLAVDGDFDLVICTEVMEHIPREGHTVALDNVCNSVAEWLLFSAAVIGQGGEGHIACRPEAEWMAELNNRGLILDQPATTRMRKAAVLPWFRRNAMLWRRP